MPSLREMSKGQYDTFREIVQKLIEADGGTSVFEYSLSSLVSHHLDSAYRPQTRSSGNLTDLRTATPDLRRLLSALAYAGTDSPDEAAASFDAGMAIVRAVGQGLPILPKAVSPDSPEDFKDYMSIHAKTKFEWAERMP